MTSQTPLVSYLALDGEPRLVANECVHCGARYFDRRNACASCGRDEFRNTDLPREGVVWTFSIVHKGGRGIDVPFVASVVDCGGTRVRANLINVCPEPDRIRIGMPVRLVTYSLGIDSAGAEAIGFAFEPSPA